MTAKEIKWRSKDGTGWKATPETCECCRRHAKLYGIFDEHGSFETLRVCLKCAKKMKRKRQNPFEDECP